MSYHQTEEDNPLVLKGSDLIEVDHTEAPLG